MEKIVIKLLDNPDIPQLKMKYVNSNEYATPKSGADGKIITGLDDAALYIISMEDVTEKKKIQAQIRKEREELEKLLGVELHPQSSFWDEFYIVLSDEEITLDPANPLDRLKEKYLVANRYVAPNREAIDNNEDFLGCIFYMHRETEENSKKVSKQRLKDKARAKLFLLYEENSAKLKIVASYIFGYNLQADINVEQAYIKLTEFIDEKEERLQKKNIETFIAAADKTPEEMMTKLILDKAIKKHIIIGRKNIYRRGEIILGNSYDEALAYLSSVENSGELVSLKKEVEKG